MEGITSFVSRLFAGYPPTPEVRAARVEVARQLCAAERAFRAEGLDEEAALCQALIQFGARAGAEEALRRTQFRAARGRFRRRYPWLIRGGLLALVAVPLLTTLIWGDVQHRLRTLALWTACIIAGVAFVIIVEYVDYRYRQNS